MRAGTLLPLLVLSVAAVADDSIARRHGDDDHDDMDMDMDMDEPPLPMASIASQVTDIASVASTSSIASTSLAPTPTPAPPAHAGGGHGHGHNMHAPVKDKLNDTDIHLWHSFPPTYLDADFRLTQDSVIFGEDLPLDWDPSTHPSHRGLMLAHVVSMVLAYFAALPIALALRAAGHPSHYLANGGFLVIALLGWLAGVAYKAAMPDMYPGAKHGGIGNLLLLLSIGLAGLDSLGLIKAGVAFYKSGNRDWRNFFQEALKSTQEDKFAAANRYEMVGLPDDDEEEQAQSRPVFSLGDDDDEVEQHQPQPTRPVRAPLRISSSRNSTGSEGTLQDTPSSSRGSAHMFEMGADRHKKPTSSSRAGHFDHHDDDYERPAWAMQDETAPVKLSNRASAARAVQIGLTWIRRTQVVIAYVAICTGIPTYVGMCRAGFINTCAAHIIKGSIFFGYGVLTFARYLGAYADIGWAWNRRPAGSTAVSAEMIECAVIFTYGITNTWMERFGAHAGDPYTVKQVQHISIAIMFWFAGLSGMLLESKRVRKVLGSAVSGRSERVQEPPSYAFSFNPLPALVIGVTGLAMAAHHQDYKFQVAVHSLWGLLLAGGSACRFLTYFFLWLRPPTESMLPSRPPTEVLTSFGWAAGGIVFMLSDEEVAFAAMRSGFDDVMAFLNITVALTCLVFCWIVVVMAVKGVALMRLQRVQLGAV